MKTIGSIFGISFLALALGLTACGPGKSTDSGSNDGDTSTGETGGDAGTGTDTGDGTGDETGGFLESDSGETDTMMDPLPNGESCTEDSECESEKCYITALGSICSDCLSGQDCMDQGAGLNCTFNGSYFECGDGSAGQQCDNTDACMDGLFCSQVINTGGLIPDMFCSECDSSADCTDPQICNPEFVPDPNMPMGQNVCVDPGTIALDAFCDWEGDGAVACETGVCSVADIMGFVTLGVCGECDDNTPCPMGEMCIEASLDINTFMVTGSRCE